MAAFLFPVLEIQFHIFAQAPAIVAELTFFLNRSRQMLLTAYCHILSNSCRQSSDIKSVVK
jgi:hypothetical protein